MRTQVRECAHIEKLTHSNGHAFVYACGDTHACIQLWRAATGKTPFHAILAHSCYRFFDGEMHYKEDALNVLVRALQSSTIRVLTIIGWIDATMDRRMGQKHQQAKPAFRDPNGPDPT